MHVIFQSYASMFATEGKSGQTEITFPKISKVQRSDMARELSETS